MSTIQRLNYLVEVIPDLLTVISEDDFCFKPTALNWSKKEILGHLIDSATNNHQRFLRVQFENIPVIFYDQNKWNTYSNYNKINSKHLIEFWKIYNRHLIELIKHIPADSLKNECNIGRVNNVTLEWLINDYIKHLEHHLQQIVAYN